MQQRVLSSVAVVVIGVVPIVAGGPIFATLMAALGLVGYAEFVRLRRNLGAPDSPASLIGYVVIAAFALVALSSLNPLVTIVGIVVLAAFAPLLAALGQPDQPTAITGASLVTTGSLYLGLPIFAAVSLRSALGTVDQQWLTSLAESAALAWQSAPRGLAWTALVVFTIWVGDSAAYLGGRSFGRSPLAPRISPKKTIEGSASGLLGSALTALLCAAVFGLNLPVIVALGFGLLIGATGQLGDLVESLIKRQAGVKDSGTLIPGHGGILDRIDALLLAFPIAWFAIALMDWSL
jgi:phosphatidate cytidylyltransferase